MSLKDMIGHDNEAVFMNTDDFAESHNLNGTVCNCVVQGLSLRERAFRVGATYEGIYEGGIVVHVKKSYLSEVPVRDELFSLDGVSYFVDECTDDIGMLTLELRRNQS